MTALALPTGINLDCRFRPTEREDDPWQTARIMLWDGPTMWLSSGLSAARGLVRTPGAVVELETWREADARYLVQATVATVELVPDARIGLRVTDAQRIQRRAYFRVTTTIDAESAWIVGDDSTDTPVALRLRDISAGGVGGFLRAPRERESLLVAVGDRMRIALQLPGEPARLSLLGQIARIDPARAPAFTHEVGVDLADIGEAERERLIRYALRVQQEQVRKGLA